MNPRFRFSQIALAVALLSGPAWAATFTVNSTGDASDATPGDGICATAGGVCTLRAAIEEANALAGTDTINFWIASGAVTIAPSSALPNITSTVHFNGYSQPGSSANTLAVGNNAVVNVRLDGASAGSGVNGLTFGVGSSISSVRGLEITGYGNGIVLDGGGGAGTTGYTIAGNFIGTDGTGADLHNNGSGIFIYNGVSNSTIGGANPADRNVIAYNGGMGIIVGNVETSGNTIRNNYIGTDPTGTAPRHNGAYAINVNSAPSTSMLDNVIGGSSGGIYIANITVNTTIRSNKLGLGADGTANIAGGGSGNGIYIASGGSGAPSQTQIGGTAVGQGNTITNWGSGGVVLDRLNSGFAFSSVTAINGNAIYNNGGLGIDLADTATGSNVGMVNANDDGDADVGANGFQNYPVVSAATTSGAGTGVSFSLDSVAVAQYRVEFFSSPTCDASGHGEGRVYLGTSTVSTDGSGHASVVVAGLPATTVGHFITMTAADVIGLGTSEFSACQAITAVAAGTPPVMGNVPNQVATVGTPFSLDISTYVTHTDGDAIMSYALTGGLPAGLSFNTSTGVISGTPTASAVYNNLVSATDKDGTSNTDAFTLTVNPAVVGTPPVMGNVPNQVATVGTPFSLGISAYVTPTDGDAITSYAISGTLPPGLGFNVATGVISGTPLATGSYTVSVSAADKDGTSNADSITIAVADVIVVPPPPPVTIPGLVIPPSCGSTTFPAIVNLSQGEGPVFVADMVGILSSAVGQVLAFLEQDVCGTVTLGGFSGGKLAFIPLTFGIGDARADGVYPMGNGRYQVVRNSQSLVIAPALVHLNQLTALFPGIAVSQGDNGVMGATVNGGRYVVQAGVAVQLDAATGAAQLLLGSDGRFHFTDALGHNQVLYPAFADLETLRGVLLGLDPNATLNIGLDGTAAIVLNGQHLTLVPDLTLSAMPAERAGQTWWQESATRYWVVNMLSQGTVQGVTVKP